MLTQFQFPKDKFEQKRQHNGKCFGTQKRNSSTVLLTYISKSNECFSIVFLFANVNEKNKKEKKTFQNKLLECLREHSSGKISRLLAKKNATELISNFKEEGTGKEIYYRIEFQDFNSILGSNYLFLK